MPILRLRIMFQLNEVKTHIKIPITISISQARRNLLTNINWLVFDAALSLNSLNSRLYVER